MVRTLTSDIRTLVDALAALEAAEPSPAEAQRRFYASSRFVCHSVLTAAHSYPGFFDPDVAAELEKLFTKGMHALDKAGAREELRRNVSIRYEKLKPFIERAKRVPDMTTAGSVAEGCLACEWPVLDGGRYLGGTLGREDIYDDHGR